MGAGTAFSFERERLAEEGVLLVSALDDAFPSRLRERLGDSCPAFLLVAGPLEFLDAPAIGVVGSRDAVRRSAGGRRGGRVGGRRVPDERSSAGSPAASIRRRWRAAIDAGAPVVGFPSEGLRVAGSQRRRSAAGFTRGELCMASPYGPSTRFTAGNAMGRNKFIYGHADVTLVVCAELGTGGTWEGAREALRRGFGRVAVWMGDGAGPRQRQAGGVGRSTR